MQFDLSSLFRPASSSLLGLDICSSAVKMVELSANPKTGYRVERYAIEMLPKDAVTDGNIANLEQVVDATRRCYKRLGTSTKNVAMALPSAAVITKKIIVPQGLRDDELEVQVESEANQYIPFAIDEINLDYQVLGPAPGLPDEVEVMIAASKKDKIEDRIAVAEASGLKPKVMDAENFAVMAAFDLIKRQLPDAGNQQIIALIDIGAYVTSLTVVRDGVQLYTREQAFGGAQLTQDIARHYGMAFEEAEASKRGGTLPEGYDSDFLTPFVETVALEVSRALQFFFTSTQFNQVDHVVLSGGCAVIPGVDELVATRAQVNTLVANPFANMVLSDKVRARNLLSDASSLMVACGLAMRRFDPS